MPVLSLELDTSIDEDIRRNYNPNQIDEDMGLPALPKILNQPNAVEVQNIQPKKVNSGEFNSTSSGTGNLVQVKPTKQTAKTNYKKSLSAQSSYITLKKGTKIKTKLLTNVSDYSPKGTRLSFVTTYPVTTTYFTIPSGTKLQGVVVNSHRPWLSGNGGLIEIKLTSISMQAEIQPISAFVANANHKKIFFNNIKGKRKYAKSMLKVMKPGSQFCKKMMGVTFNLARDGSSVLISPFSFTAGILALGGNVIVSPVIALFYKGEHISFKSGNEFVFKLDQDVFVYK